MMNDRVYVIKFYVFNLDTKKCTVHLSKQKHSRAFVYEPFCTIRGIEELNIVRSSNGTVEYAERTMSDVKIYKEMPNHWLVRVLTAVETE